LSIENARDRADFKSGHFSINPSAGSGNRCWLNACDRRGRTIVTFPALIFTGTSSGIGFAVTAVTSYKQIVRG
jgi:hypothetical protein